MGVIYTNEASKVFLDLIRNNKSCSINQAVKECQMQGVGCSHHSGNGKDKVTLAQGLTYCVYDYLLHHKCLKALKPDPLQKAVLKMFGTNQFDSDNVCHYKTFESIRWAIAPAWKKRADEIKPIDYHDL